MNYHCHNCKKDITNQKIFICEDGRLLCNNCSKNFTSVNMDWLNKIDEKIGKKYGRRF